MQLEASWIKIWPCTSASGTHVASLKLLKLLPLSHNHHGGPLSLQRSLIHTSMISGTPQLVYMCGKRYWECLWVLPVERISLHPSTTPHFTRFGVCVWAGGGVMWTMSVSISVFHCSQVHSDLHNLQMLPMLLKTIIAVTLTCSCRWRF